jgi:alpha-aminoadipic semialdehyde synthase
LLLHAQDCGEAIRLYGLPEEICPLTVVVTGSGNVAQGALEVLDRLPHARADPFELERIVATARGRDRTHTLHVAIAKDRHMVRKRAPGEPMPSVISSRSMLDLSASRDSLSSPCLSPTGQASLPSAEAAVQLARAASEAPFDSADYRAHPEGYAPLFHLSVLPYTSVLVNCMYWEECFPRLVTTRQARDLHAAGRLRLVGVCDISCDLRGSVELLEEFTSIEKPFFVYDVAGRRVLHDLEAAGVLYHAVDHLPSECPRDASMHFGACLLPFMHALLRSDAARPPDSPESGLPAELAGAVVCWGGQLAQNFDYIAELRASAERARLSHASRHTAAADLSVFVELDGHLFDNHVVGRILDIVEESVDVSARIVDCRVGKDRRTTTHMRLQLDTPGSR